MSIRKDGFLSYSELQAFERRARELRGQAIREGVSSLFGLNKKSVMELLIRPLELGAWSAFENGF